MKKRIIYGKRKLEKIQAVSSKTVSNLIGVSQEDLRAQSFCRKCTDLDEILHAVKAKVMTASINSEKFQLLTLIPSSWSVER